MASNGVLHQLDTVLMDVANVQARVDAYYKTTDFYLGDTDDITLATSSRSNHTILSKMDDMAVWVKDTAITKDGGYLFFTLPKELAAADYKVYIEHEVDSAYTDVIQISVNGQVINESLMYDDSVSVVAGTPGYLVQEVGTVSFDTYQKGTQIRFDIVEERNGQGILPSESILPNDTIVKVKRITFEPFENEEGE